MQKHYKTLGLKPNKQYTPHELKEAWRKKCMEVHPDRGGTEEAFNEVTHAFNYLTDPSYRNEHRESNRINLIIRLHIPISFEEGFFGTSLILNYNRPLLDKTGKLVIEDEYSVASEHVTVPPATCAPTDFILAGKGMRMQDTTETGDAIVTILPEMHPRFSIRGLDVISNEQVSLDKMLKGALIEVETMYGIQVVKIPPGTPPGTLLRINFCGISKIGSHLVHIHPLFPSKEELRHGQQWKDLNIAWEEL